MNTFKHHHKIDYNKLYGLDLEYDPAKRRLKIRVSDDGNPWPRFVENITGLMCEDRGGKIRMAKQERENGAVVFNNVDRDFRLMLGSQFLGEYTLDANSGITLDKRRRLIVDETRRIGTFHNCEPYSEHREGVPWEETRALMKAARHAVFTDIHTHSSGQISARGLVETALEYAKHSGGGQYYYPVALLKDAGIATDYDHIPKKSRKTIPRVRFRPKEKPEEIGLTEVEGADLVYLFHKHPEDREKLIANMALPADRQSTFKHLEYFGNRFRYPFSKDAKLTQAIREEEAREYRAQGVKLALSAYVSIDDPPHVFRTLHAVAEANEKSNTEESQFNQRFIIGIPRNLSPDEMRVALEKAKILMGSPLVVGIDILGYEANKTREFVALLDDYAKWADAHKPGSFIRVHAGENDKNHDNVKDFLKVAVKYRNVNYLVGHGVYGMDEETTKIARELCSAERRQLTIEFNPSSNIALNNVNDVRQIPFANALKNKLEFIVGSDSAGMYHTDATQLGLSAYYAGLDEKGFDALRTHQESVVKKIEGYCKSVAASIPGWNSAEGRAAHVESILKQVGEVKKATSPVLAVVTQEAIAAKLKADAVSLIERGEMPPELKGKVPITIVGASGESWTRLTPAQQRENAIAIDMLIHALGDNCYIVQGRNKGKEGLCQIINKSLTASNRARKKAQPHQKELFTTGILVNPSFDLNDSYKHLSHMIHIPGTQLDLPDAIVDYTFEHDGVLIAAAGAAYTADIITEADQRGIHAKHPDNRKMMMLLRQGGASDEKADVLHPDYGAIDGKQLVKRLFDNRRDLFAPDFDLTQLNALYKDSVERVKQGGAKVSQVHHRGRTGPDAGIGPSEPLH